MANHPSHRPPTATTMSASSSSSSSSLSCPNLAGNMMGQLASRARSCLGILLLCVLILLTIRVAPSSTAITTLLKTNATANEATVSAPPPQPPPPPASATPITAPPPRKREKRVCSGVHIRNDLKSFEQLQNCDIIDGPLTIALVSNQTVPYESKDYENITFPDLVEVTDYLLFFRVQGLTTLAKLFPNLSVIRGRDVVSNYALIIYEMLDLQKINLPKLTDILRGSVRIERNPNLCYVQTVNWEAICKYTFTPHFIKDNNARCDNRCPENCHPWRPDPKISSGQATKAGIQGDIRELGAENNRSLFCWSNQVCHETCYNQQGDSLLSAPNGGCCSRECAGGCFQRDRSDQCFSCRSVSQGDTCVSQCPRNLYEFKGKCIDEQDCERKAESTQQSDECSREPKTSNFKALRPPDKQHGICQIPCLKGFEEDPSNRHKCKPCDKGTCRKVCTPQDGSEKAYTITDIKTLQEIAGCSVINASVEISMKGGKNVLDEMEKAFQNLEEIRGYLKITRSYPILTLNFLQNLKAINGSQLDRGQYSLILIDNPNLQELFLRQSQKNSTQIVMPRGTVFAHLNPKLCPFRIKKLKEYTTIADWDNRDVSEHTNGDKETCSEKKLQVQFVEGMANLARIKFENMLLGLDDQRVLLFYLISYREVAHGTITMFDGRDGCSSANDMWITEEEAPEKNHGEQFQLAHVKVKPATRYALYVKTFTISQAAGAVSDIIYFETAPDTPGHPRMVKSEATSPESVVVSWMPPLKPNGKIERYFITIRQMPELDDIQNFDVCNSIIDRDKITESLTQDEPTRTALIPASSINNGTSPADSASNTACSKTGLSNDADLHVEQVTFQDIIIDIVYLKHEQCRQITLSKPLKRKRSIEHKLSTSDGTEDNQLPRTAVANRSSSKEVMVEARNTIKTNTSSDANEISIHHLNHREETIRFDSSRDKTLGNVTSNANRRDKFSLKITDLSHFRRYAIEIVACHGEFKSDRSKTSKSYNRCGLQALTQVRTQAIPDNDRINSSSITFFLANETSSAHMLTWQAPERPNGLVLAFRMRYREKGGSLDVWSEVCTNASSFERDQGYRLPALKSGVYVASIQTVSMYTARRFWSEEFEFEIPHEELLSPLALTLLVVTIIAVLVLAVASGAYCVQKRNRDDLIYASVNPDYVQYDPDEWEVDKENLKVENQIGTGSFGLVFKGQLSTEKGTRECAVKTVPPTATAKQRMDFLREASTMKQFDTFHVVKLLGVISVTTPVYVVMEYMANGDLKDYLRKQRDIHQKQKKTLVDGVFLMAAQIADGMAYLASKKFVHRDLAARNCMVGDSGVVKIGDFGLTRDIYQNEYYRRGTADRLPVRWMAPESLKDNIYTSASDVWSYGIVLWEIITFSAYPYQGQSNDEVIKRVIQGYTMPRPEHCPDKLYRILEGCWKKHEKERPSFLSIVEFLLPDTDGKLYPNCFYRKSANYADGGGGGGGGGDSITQTTLTEETVNGTESFPLLSWPSANHRANGNVNGENHVNHVPGNNHIDKNH